MVEIKWLKQWRTRKIGDISNASEKSASNFVSQGYAEYVEEPKKTTKKKINDIDQLSGTITGFMGECNWKEDFHNNYRECVRMFGVEDVEHYLRLKNIYSPKKETGEPEEEEIFEDVNLKEVFEEILRAMDYYLDLPRDAKVLIGLWILSTHYYEEFPTFPILFLNAMRGSGKTRTLGLCSHLSKGLSGKVENNITESGVFRSTGALFLDEMERLKGNDKSHLITLLNSCYKKGSQTTRMAKSSSKDAETYKPEKFDLFRPVALANINGIDSILEDRSLIVILERSFDEVITSRIEDFDSRLNDLKLKLGKIRPNLLNKKVTSDDGDDGDDNVSIKQVISGWNSYIDCKSSILPECVTIVTSSLSSLYEKIFEKRINGRSLEIAFPLIIIASQISGDVFEEVLDIFSKMAKKRREDELDTTEILLYKFVSELDLGIEPYRTATELRNRFQEFVSFDLELTPNAFSGLCKRLKLIEHKKRKNTGRLIKLDISKAKTKIGFFERNLE